MSSLIADTFNTDHLNLPNNPFDSVGGSLIHSLGKDPKRKKVDYDKLYPQEQLDEDIKAWRNDQEINDLLRQQQEQMQRLGGDPSQAPGIQGYPQRSKEEIQALTNAQVELIKQSEIAADNQSKRYLSHLPKELAIQEQYAARTDQRKAAINAAQDHRLHAASFLRAMIDGEANRMLGQANLISAIAGGR